MEQDLRFGSYRFEPRTGRLWCDAEELHLTPKASAVLNELISRAGTPVSKEELFASVWAGTIVSDDALTSCIQELRRAFGDDPRRPSVIETRHRRGYRFIAALSGQHEAAAGTSRDAGISTIAVLPFVDMSPAGDQGYLCDGLAEELIGALSHIDGLRVAARTTSFRFRGGAEDVREIGRKLGVAALLEGSVRKVEDRLRVNVQLVETDSGFELWSQRFDTQLGDLFAIQDEIAQRVATLLRGEVLSQRERQGLIRPHARVESFEYYLRARQHLPRMTRHDLEQSADYFRQAIELDANYAPAYAGLATVHATLHEWFGASEEDLTAAQQASARALALGPEFDVAHVARGCVLALSRRYADAIQEFEAAIRLNPNLFDAYYYCGRAMFASGDIAGSAEQFRSAAAVRKEDFQSPVLLAQALRMLGRTEEAADANREGIRRAQHALALNPHDGRALSLGGVAFFFEGDSERAIEWTDRAVVLYPEDPSALINAACVRSKAKQVDAALQLLERVFARGWGKRDWIEHDPDYDNLRGDPRFERLLARLK